MTETCGAKTRAGTPCPNAAMPNGRCRMHGGSTPHGSALPQFKTGRYSKYLPERLAAKYEEAEADPLLLEQTSEIALLGTRAADLISKLGTGESVQLLGIIALGLGEARTKLKETDLAAADALLENLIGFVARAHSDAALWGEIVSLVDQRRKLVESERKRYVEMGQVATLNEVFALIGALGASIKANVHDPAIRAALAADLARITGGTLGRSHQPVELAAGDAPAADS